MDFVANKQRATPTHESETRLDDATHMHDEQRDETMNKLEQINEQHNMHADIIKKMLQLEFETFKKSATALANVD